jgi:hypothetical protein
MLIVSFYVQGVMRYEFVPQSQTVNQNYYNDTLEHPQENVQQNRPEVKFRVSPS